MTVCNSDEETYYQKNKEVILNRAKDSYENYRERLKKQAREKIQKFFWRRKEQKERIWKKQVP